MLGSGVWGGGRALCIPQAMPPSLDGAGRRQAWGPRWTPGRRGTPTAGHRLHSRPGLGRGEILRMPEPAREERPHSRDAPSARLVLLLGGSWSILSAGPGGPAECPRLHRGSPRVSRSPRDTVLWMEGSASGKRTHSVHRLRHARNQVCAHVRDCTHACMHTRAHGP